MDLAKFTSHALIIFPLILHARNETHPLKVHHSIIVKKSPFSLI